MTASAKGAVRSLDGREVVWEPHPRQHIALTCPVDELLYGGAKGGGKLLTLDVMIPTPTGWVRNGDIQVGDEVLGENGRPVRVIWTSEVTTDEDAYRLTFSDGTSIIAGERHLWKTMTADDRAKAMMRDPEWQSRRRAKRPRRGTGAKPWLAAKNSARAHVYLPPPEASIRNTGEIHASLYVKRGVVMANHSIANHAPLELPVCALPIPSYTLGAWLGDGTSLSGGLTGIDCEIWERIQADGFAVTHHANSKSHNIAGLAGFLRSAGLRGNKNIPPAYLRAQHGERLALLHGLMDTDGWCEKDGSCKIALTSKVLFDGVVELIRTFGITVNVSHGFKTATNGTEGNRSECWTACFVTDLPAFHLPRKLARQNRTPHARYGRRFIVGAENLGPQPMRCIQIANPDGMYLAGEQFIPTHNSDFIVMAAYEQIALADAKFRATGRQQRGRAVLFRKNLKRLDDLIARSKELFPTFDRGMSKKKGCGWNAEKKRWVFTSGFVFDFDHLDGPDDHEAYHGQEITALLFDQVEEVPFEVYQYLVANVRAKDDDMRKLLMVRCTANPGGKHAKWVKDYFVAPHRAGNKIISDTIKLPSGRSRTVTRCFVPAKLEDNPNLYNDPQYEAALEKLPEHMRKMYRDGDWDVVIGSFFSGKIDARVHVIKPFPLPPNWEVRHGTDWGSSAPACTEFGTRDNDGNVYFIDEIYGPGGTGRAYAERFHKKLANQKWSPAKKWTSDEVYGLIDNQAFYKSGAEGPTAGESMLSAGMRIFEANKNRKAGIEQWLERLSLDSFGQPKVYIFEGRCPRLLAALQTIASNPKDPDDYDPHDREHSHAVDAGRYLLVDWPVGTNPDNATGDEDVNRWMDLARKRDAIHGREASLTGYGD